MKPAVLVPSTGLQPLSYGKKATRVLKNLGLGALTSDLPSMVHNYARLQFQVSVSIGFQALGCADSRGMRRTGPSCKLSHKISRDAEYSD